MLLIMIEASNPVAIATTTTALEPEDGLVIINLRIYGFFSHNQSLDSYGTLTESHAPVIIPVEPLTPLPTPSFNNPPNVGNSDLEQVYKLSSTLSNMPLIKSET
jgi:hypothetical protein